MPKNSRLALCISSLILLGALGACATKGPVSTPASPSITQPIGPAPQASGAQPDTIHPQPATPVAPCLDCEAAPQEKNRASCYKLQPGKTTKTKKGKTVLGRCQPQSLIYARCRTGIMTCRLGDTSPVQWFACAKKNNATSSTPKAHSVMVLDVNKRRGMPTGHPAYVEEAWPNADGTWTLRISHTNYDRKCHLDLDAKVIFYPQTMEASFQSGPWSTWAKRLNVCGFILR